MVEESKIKTFIRKHPTEVVVVVAVLSVCIGWKLKNRSITKEASKIAKQVVDLEVTEELLNKLLEDGGSLVFDLPKTQKVSKAVLTVAPLVVS